MLTINADYEGLDELADAFQNAPALVAAAAEQAGREALPIIRQHILPFTPKITGFLQESVDVVLLDTFNLQAEATAAYADFVHQRVPFLQLGVADAEAEIDAIYDRALDRVAEGFGRAE